MTDGSDRAIGSEDVDEILRDFVAMERDRLLGYADEELHREPADVLEDALVLLNERGDDTDELVLVEDQEVLKDLHGMTFPGDSDE